MVKQWVVITPAADHQHQPSSSWHSGVRARCHWSGPCEAMELLVTYYWYHRWYIRATRAALVLTGVARPVCWDAEIWSYLWQESTGHLSAPGASAVCSTRPACHWVSTQKLFAHLFE